MGLEFCELLEKEFDACARSFAGGSFCQSTKMGNLLKLLGFEVHYYGVKNSRENKLLAAACMTIRKSSSPLFGILRKLRLENWAKAALAKFNIYHQKAEVYGGPLVNQDLHNADQGVATQKTVWHFLVRNLKEVAASTGASKLWCNPNMVVRHLDLCGKFVSSGEVSKEFMKTLGFYETAPISPTFHYKKDLQEYASVQELFSSYAAKTRAEIRAAQNNCLSVRALEKTELVVFSKILKATGQRRGFASRGLEYYEAFYDAFARKNSGEDLKSAQFLVAEVDFAKLHAHLSTRKEQLINQIRKLNGNSRKVGAKKELENQLKAVEKRQEKYSREFLNCETLPVCAGLFVCANREMVYLFGGSLAEYMDLKAVYFLVSGQLENAYSRGLEVFNFYGVGPNFALGAPESGVLAFKQGFGGRIDELIGQWVLPLQ
ncbi:MAG: aminoacyltransferase [Candidatus Ancillula trichonymphae]|nr:aminoacyltransferase [Candidatus Ancillula trichonymphae]